MCVHVHHSNGNFSCSPKEKEFASNKIFLRKKSKKHDRKHTCYYICMFFHSVYHLHLKQIHAYMSNLNKIIAEQQLKRESDNKTNKNCW